MAFTITLNPRGSVGDCYSISGTATSVPGDNTLTITHGMNMIQDQCVHLCGAIGAVPKIVSSAGVATVTFDDTLGAMACFYFVGK